jgi:hypothetical protein
MLMTDSDQACCTMSGENLMVAAIPNDRIPFDGSKLTLPVNRVVERVRYYFDQQRVRSEIDFRERREKEHGLGLARREGEGITGWSAPRRPLSAEDICVHAWLNERLAVLTCEQHGLWPRLRRFLPGTRVAR